MRLTSEIAYQYSVHPKMHLNKRRALICTRMCLQANPMSDLDLDAQGCKHSLDSRPLHVGRESIVDLHGLLSDLLSLTFPF